MFLHKQLVKIEVVERIDLFSIGFQESLYAVKHP